jgi:hypothetical protein
MELIPKFPPPGTWLVLKIPSGKDKREKIEVAICRNCIIAIDAARGTRPETPKDETGEAA